MGTGAICVEVHLASQQDSKGRILAFSDCALLGSPLISWLPSWHSVVETCISQAQENTSNLMLTASAQPFTCCPCALSPGRERCPQPQCCPWALGWAWH